MPQKSAHWYQRLSKGPRNSCRATCLMPSLLVPFLLGPSLLSFPFSLLPALPSVLSNGFFHSLRLHISCWLPAPALASDIHLAPVTSNTELFFLLYCPLIYKCVVAVCSPPPTQQPLLLPSLLSLCSLKSAFDSSNFDSGLLLPSHFSF